MPKTKPLPPLVRKLIKFMSDQMKDRDKDYQGAFNDILKAMQKFNKRLQKLEKAASKK